MRQPSYSLPASVLAELRLLQELTVRLYFSDEEQQAWQTHRRSAIARLDLSSRTSQLVPTVGSAAFEAESFGRRFLIAMEIALRYPNTLNALIGSSAPKVVVESQPFRRFLGSDYFLTAKRGLPHPNGVGAGYEAVTKFFFWLRDSYALHPDTSNQTLRCLAFAELGAHVVGFAQSMRLPIYDAARRGVYFTIIDGGETNAVAVWRDSSVKFVNLAQVEHPREAGLQDLDDLDQFVAEHQAPIPMPETEKQP